MPKQCWTCPSLLVGNPSPLHYLPMIFLVAAVSLMVAACGAHLYFLKERNLQRNRCKPIAQPRECDRELLRELERFRLSKSPRERFEIELRIGAVTLGILASHDNIHTPVNECSMPLQETERRTTLQDAVQSFKRRLEQRVAAEGVTCHVMSRKSPSTERPR